MKEVRPTFDRPPVVEQAITLMFEPISGFSIGDFGLFWERIREEFPSCVGQEPLGHAIETFGQAQPFRLDLTQGMPLPRALYRHANNGELVQVQHDRFSFNWMLTDGATYPSHDATVRRFWHLFDQFREFLAGRSLGEPLLTQCELTNVNIMPLAEFGGSFVSALDAFNLAVPPISSCDNLSLESVQIATHHVLADDEGNPIGRLHGELQPVRSLNDDQAAIRFDLTARGALRGLARDTAPRFFENARTAINAAFLAYTSKEARAHWGERK